MPVNHAAPRPIAGAMQAAALAAVLLLAPLLSGCGGNGDKARGPGGLAFTPIAPDVFAVVIAPDANVPKTEAAFHKQCDERPSCTIYGWTEAAAAAHGVPLDDRHYATLAVRYVAHAAGNDDMMWDCLRFRAAKAPCLPKA
ncbi:hypothetical protein GCM10009087_16470 [Sphingomonas oligophenolica]|uniref:DUF4189 domain-containing protein n=1 Tax=Sphingomonas oligophenolica TaxID=301154 RepID=A0ABU9Y7R3_9SPHN